MGTIVEQFIPEVDNGIVQRVAYRDFPPDQYAKVLELIEGSEVRGTPRVLLACLKVAGGNMQVLKEQLADASGYYREIICEAEYPNYTRKATRMDRLPEDKQRVIIELDKSQYLEWLNKS
jgi:hypothetical protein